jgi:hypothetical protein
MMELRPFYPLSHFLGELRQYLSNELPKKVAACLSLASHPDPARVPGNLRQNIQG